MGKGPRKASLRRMYLSPYQSKGSRVSHVDAFLEREQKKGKIPNEKSMCLVRLRNSKEAT